MFLRNLFVAALAAGVALAVPLTKADASLEARGGGAWFHSAANENEFFDEKSTSKRHPKSDMEARGGGAWFHSAANENEFFDEKSTSKRDLKSVMEARGGDV
ncbi:hypothetical protein SCARD494_09661 [Seiridium cardinale]